MKDQISNNTFNRSIYFNLIADGIGFLNRPRVVKAKKPYYALTIQASRGDSNEKTRFDLRVVGGQAKELMDKLLKEFPILLDKEKFNQHPIVGVGFRAGDILPSSFEMTNKETGVKTTTLFIDGRLLKFKFIKVNHQLWFKETENKDVK